MIGVIALNIATRVYPEVLMTWNASVNVIWNINLIALVVFNYCQRSHKERHVLKQVEERGLGEDDLVV